MVEKPITQGSSHKEEPVYKIDLKKTPSISKPSVSSGTDEAEPKKYPFDLEKAEAASKRPSLATSKEASYKVNLTHVESASPATEAPTDKNEPRETLEKPAEASNFKVPLKKVETVEKPITRGSSHKEEPVYKIDLKKTPSISKPTVPSTTSYKVNLKHVESSENATMETSVSENEDPIFNLHLKKFQTYKAVSEPPAKPAFATPLTKVSIEPKPRSEFNGISRAGTSTTKIESSAFAVTIGNRSDHSVDSQSKMEERRAFARKELVELRALGLTKKMSTKGLESDYSDKQGNEDNDFPADKGQDLASSQSQFSDVETAENDSQIVSATAPGPTKAQEELERLRSMGLTQAKSKKGIPSDGVKQVEITPSTEEPPVAARKSATEKELEELRARGLAKAISNKGISDSAANDVPRQEPVPLENSQAGAFVSPEDKIHAVIDSDDEDVLYLDTDDESGALAVLPHPKDDVQPHQAQKDKEDEIESLWVVSRPKHDDQPVAIHEGGSSPSTADGAQVDDTNAKEPQEMAMDRETPAKLKKKKSKKTREDTASTFTPEAKAALRRQRRESREKFKGAKRFIFGKKMDKASG